MDKKYLGYIYMISVALIWGVAYTAIKILLGVMDPFTLGSVRFIFSLIFFVPVVFLIRVKIERKDLITIVMMGLTGVALYQIFYNSGAEGVSAGLGSIFISTEPIFIYLLSMVFLNERFRVSKMLGIIISFLGIFIIFFEEIRTITGLISIILITLASISWSIYTILSKNVLEKYNVLYVTSLSSIIGTFFIIPFFFKFPILVYKFNIFDWFSLFFLVAFATFLAFYLNFKGVNILSPSTASVFYYLAPIFTILSAYILIHETITIVTIIGGILVIGGVAIVNK